MESGTISRRERKKLETKANILNSARKLFERKGFENTSIEDITEYTDISKGTFFNYFTSKDSLLAGIAEDEVDDVIFYAEEELTDIPSHIQKIRLALKRLMDDSIPFLHLTGRVMFTSIICSGESLSPFVKINALIEEMVKEAQKCGEISDRYIAADIVTTILGGYYGVIFRWFEYGCKPGDASELDNVLNIIFQAIK